MKRVLFLLSLVLCLVSCADKHRADGIYPTETGWDIVNHGKVYEYRCEPHGLFLYIDWDGRNHFALHFKYQDKIYRRTVQRSADYSATVLEFSRVGDDGRHAYFAPWSDFDGSLTSCQEVTFDLDNPDEVEMTLSYRDFRSVFHLMEKYAH